MEIPPLADSLVQFFVYLLIAPSVIGMLNWFKARLQGRGGPSPLQPYRDLWKLFRRQPVVIPEDASWIFLAAPGIILGCYVILGLLIPIISTHSIKEDESLELLVQIRSLFTSPPVTDLLGVIFILGLARFAAGLAGLDSGSPFGGLGSGREMFFHVLAEPTLLLTAFALSLISKTTGLLRIFQTHDSLLAKILASQAGENMMIVELGLGLALLALVLVMLAEAGRMPFDNSATHLELTMTGKAIQLEYSGPLLAMLEYAEALRLTFFITLLYNLFLPMLLGPADVLWPMRLAYAGLYSIKLFLAVFGLAIWELSRARLRLRSVVEPAFLALGSALLAVVILALQYIY
jgi:formate hydrogenlyase subunit 4